jgi:hypothetical protein
MKILKDLVEILSLLIIIAWATIIRILIGKDVKGGAQLYHYRYDSKTGEAYKIRCGLLGPLFGRYLRYPS